MTDQLSSALAGALHSARTANGLSVNTLAKASGVSRAMIGKIERGEAQPTAILLSKLSAALGMTLSELVTRAEKNGQRLIRAAEQPSWTDPESGYLRRMISPRTGTAIELVEIELPAGAEVVYPNGEYLVNHQLIWVLQGRLHFSEDTIEHDLATGDCLLVGPPATRSFRNPAKEPCRYLIALTKRNADFSLAVGGY